MPTTSPQPAIAPGAPSTPNVVEGRRQLTLSWNAPSSPGTDTITEYDVQYRVEGTLSWTVVHDVVSNLSSLTYTIASLTAGQTYEVEVRAVSDAGDGTWSLPGTGTAQSLVVPVAPAVPTVTAESDGDLRVGWTAPSDNGGATITAYDLRYRKQGSGWTEINPAWETGGGNLQYTIPIADLERGQTYDVQVRAVNSVGDGVWSDSTSQTTTATTPSAPTITSLTPADQSILVQWAAPTNTGGAAITGYDIRHRIGSGAWTTINPATVAGTRSYTIMGLTNDTEYTVVVRAVNLAGNGAWSDEVNATPVSSRQTVIIIEGETPVVEDVFVLIAPSKIAIMSVSAGHHRLTVHWCAPVTEGSSEVIYYDLRIRSGAEWTLIDRASDDLSHLIRGLSNDVEYDLQVRAVNNELPGPWSDIYRASPIASRIDRVGLIRILEWNNRMWGITQSGQLYCAFDFDGGWITDAKIPTHETPVTDMFLFRNATNNSVIFVMTETSLWAHDQENEQFVKTEVTFPRSARNGTGCVVWRGNLYIPVGNSIYSFTGGSGPVLSLIGPDRDDGRSWQGETQIIKLLATHNSLLAVVKSTETGADADGTSHVLSYDETGWQNLWTPDGEAHKIIQDAFVATTLNEYSLWLGHEEMEVIDLPIDILNPAILHPTRRYAASGYTITPWFNSDESEIEKLALEVKLEAMHLAAGRTLQVEYQLDYDDSSWATLTTLSSDTQTRDGAERHIQRFLFPDADDADEDNPAGMIFSAIRFRVTAESDDADETPDLVALTLEFRKVLDIKWGFQVSLNLNDLHKGKSAAELRESLIESADKKELVSFIYRNEGDLEDKRYWVELERPQLAEQTGYGERGSALVYLSEI